MKNKKIRITIIVALVIGIIAYFYVIYGIIPSPTYQMAKMKKRIPEAIEFVKIYEESLKSIHDIHTSNDKVEMFLFQATQESGELYLWVYEYPNGRYSKEEGKLEFSISLWDSEYLNDEEKATLHEIFSAVNGRYNSMRIYPPSVIITIYSTSVEGNQTYLALVCGCTTPYENSKTSYSEYINDDWFIQIGFTYRA